jgi:predicted nuclease with RNAse H fold
MQRAFRTFLGVDLGGGKGKNTAVARLEDRDGVLQVVEVGTTHEGHAFHDEKLIAYLGAHAEGAVLAIDAPLTLTACVRCREPVCPGFAACVDPAIVWFRTAGAELVAHARDDRNRIAAVPANGKVNAPIAAAPTARKPHTTPYTQRATEVVLHRRHGVVPRETLGQGMGPLTARAAHLVRALAGHRYHLNQNLLEVYPKATIHMLYGQKVARSYKREVDTWETRARVLESLRGQLDFAPRSGLARETVLQNDHCFDAVVCAYTAYLWARDGWSLPEEHREVFAVDGWIWAPPASPGESKGQSSSS